VHQEEDQQCRDHWPNGGQREGHPPIAVSNDPAGDKIRAGEADAGQ